LSFGNIALDDNSLNVSSSFLNIYPNPAITNSQVKVVLDKEISELIVYDMTGKLIQNISNVNAKEYILNVNNFRPGLFTLLIKTKNNLSYSKKIIIHEQ
jgi:hypothetical protein